MHLLFGQHYFYVFRIYRNVSVMQLDCSWTWFYVVVVVHVFNLGSQNNNKIMSCDVVVHVIRDAKLNFY